MYKQYLKIILRILSKRKLYAAINIGGLTIALTTSLLIYKHIVREWNSDCFHPETENIYRIVHSDDYSDQWSGRTYGIFGPTVKAEIPGIKAYTRCHFPGPTGIRPENSKTLFSETSCLYADKTFFDFFHFPILTGNIHVSATVNWAVISRKKAKQYFGDQNPIGKTLLVKYLHQEDPGKTYQIIAVMEDLPVTSSIQADIVLDPSHEKRIFEQWGVEGGYVFLQPEDNVDLQEIEKALPDLIAKHFPIGVSNKESFKLQSYRDIYFHSAHIAPDDLSRGSLPFTLLLCGITLLILFLAASNYLIIQTAQLHREIGKFAMQKCFGAGNNSFKNQVFTEIGLQVFVALIIAIPLSYSLHPMINSIVSPYHPYDFTFTRKESILFLCLIGSIIGMIGSFLYFYIRKRLGRNALYRSIQSAPNRLDIKNILAILQITIFSALLFSSIVIYNQMNYIEHKKLGYQPENTLYFIIPDHPELCKEELLRNPYILSVSNGSPLPQEYDLYIDICADEHAENRIKAQTLIGDSDYLSTYRIQLLEGRTPRELPGEYDPDDNRSYYGEILVNEALVKALHLNSPLGTILHMYETRVKIVGVTKNFHFNPLYQPIYPLIIYPNIFMHSRIILVRYPEEKRGEVIEYIRKTYSELYPNSYFDCNEYTGSGYYEKDRATVKMIIIFTLIAVLIGGMGIFAFSTFLAENKRKEIALRKINGASEWCIIGLLNRNFMQKTALSCVIGIPLAYFWSHKWLEGFAYKIEISVWIFIFVPWIVALIVFGVTTWQIGKAARTNPVEVLKNE